MPLSFYREQKRWSFPHAVNPLAVYIATRDPVLSVLAAYVWESAEFLIALRAAYFRETADDSLIGDPLNAALAVLGMFLIDRALGWDVLFVSEVGLARRLLCLGAVAAPASLIEVGGERRRQCVHTGVLGYAVFYTAAALAFYAPIFAHVSAGTVQSILVWLLVVNIHALVVAPMMYSKELPPYVRTVSVSAVVIAVGTALQFVDN